jgi:hypothetical protein
MACVTAAVAVQAQQAQRPVNPARLAIYYGIPSLLNGAAGDLDRAARELAAYDLVVLGDGLQNDGPEHASTTAIVSRLGALRPSLRVFGYVAIGDSHRLSLDQITDGVRRWRAMGADGVLLDEAGYDFGVTRERQNQAVDAVHHEGLRAFVNAFDPDDVLSPKAVMTNARGGGNPAGLPSRLEAADLLLLESFAVRNGAVESPEGWFQRAQRADAHRDRMGIEIWTVTTATDRRPFDARLCSLAWWSTVLWGFSGFGWGEPDYSARLSVLPSRSCGASLSGGGMYVGGVVRERSRFTRKTDNGWVEVDFSSRSGRLIARSRP